MRLTRDECVKVLDLYVESHNYCRCYILLSRHANQLRPFDRGSMHVCLYWQPSNDRARVVIVLRDRHGQEEVFCRPLTDLRMIRDGSVLQLCKQGRDVEYVAWAKLNFYFHERACHLCCFPGRC